MAFAALWEKLKMDVSAALVCEGFSNTDRLATLDDLDGPEQSQWWREVVGGEASDAELDLFDELIVAAALAAARRRRAIGSMSSGAFAGHIAAQQLLRKRTAEAAETTKRAQKGMQPCSGAVQRWPTLWGAKRVRRPPETHAEMDRTDRMRWVRHAAAAIRLAGLPLALKAATAMDADAVYARCGRGLMGVLIYTKGCGNGVVLRCGSTVLS